MRPLLQIPPSPAHGTKNATVKKIHKRGNQTHDELSTILAFLCPGRSPSRPPPQSHHLALLTQTTFLLKQSHFCFQVRWLWLIVHVVCVCVWNRQQRGACQRWA